MTILRLDGTAVEHHEAPHVVALMPALTVGVVVAPRVVGVTATRFYRSGSALVAVRTGGTGTVTDGLSWVVTDRQGTITATVPAGSTTGSVNRYRPFGVNRATARGFLARGEDPDGLVATDHRLYDPTIGWFLTIDPLLDQTRDPYGYGAGNPATMSDPSGLCVVDFCWDDRTALFRPDAVTAGYQGAVAWSPSVQRSVEDGDLGAFRRRQGEVRLHRDGYFLSRNGCGICTAQELMYHALADAEGARTWHREALALSDHLHRPTRGGVALDFGCLFVCLQIGLDGDGTFSRFGLGLAVASPGIRFELDSNLPRASFNEVYISADVGPLPLSVGGGYEWTESLADGRLNYVRGPHGLPLPEPSLSLPTKFFPKVSGGFVHWWTAGR